MRLVIGGVYSGVGKTTIVAGLVAALRRRGLAVQPFKVGPDYIDPSYHALAAGRPCYNLDPWMLPPEQIASLFQHHARHADIAIIEGVMGLFDGQNYLDETGSTAQVAKQTASPVLLVLDAGAMARSAAAMALGFQQFDPQLPIAGYIVNYAGGAAHGKGVAEAIERATGLPVLGWLPRVPALQIPERHLGLVPTAEHGKWADFIFIYQENLDLLQSAGAEIVFFSPIHDPALPAGTRGVILSGGFPELYAKEIAANDSMRRSLKDALARNVPIYAECGGLMALTESIKDLQGQEHPMAGLLPGCSRLTDRLILGYRLAEGAAGSWLVPPGETVRGHEFHYSVWEKRPESLPPAYTLHPFNAAEELIPEGACLGSLLASYVHLSFWTNPTLADRFVARCRETQPGDPSHDPSSPARPHPTLR